MIMLKRFFIVIFILTFFHVQSQENMENTIYQFKVKQGLFDDQECEKGYQKL